jgi:hypothetical protein
MDLHMKKINFHFPAGRIFHTAACLMQGFYMLGFRVASSVKPTPETIDSRGISRPFAVTDPSFVEPLIDRRDGFLIIDITHGVDDLTREICAVEDPDSFALLNMSDTANFMDYDPRYRVFSAHQNRFATRRGTIYPMPFGMSQDLIIRTADARKVERRNGMVLSNFTPSLSQGVRNALSIMLEEPLAQQGILDRGLWSEDEYLKKLSSASAILAYGGDFYRDLSKAEAFEENPQYRFKTFEKDVVILRWDSWRLYEGLATGCNAVINDPFKYGFEYYSGYTIHNKLEGSVHFLELENMVEPIRILSQNSGAPGGKARGEMTGFIGHEFCPQPMAQYILLTVN